MSNRDIEAKYREKGFYSFSSAWEKLQEEEKKQVFALAEDYKHFLDNGKIERECVEQIVSMARIAGFVELEEMIKAGRQLEPGIKVMAVNRNKAVALFVIGEKPLSEGLRIVGSHIDSPRLDQKPQPLLVMISIKRSVKKSGDSPSITTWNPIICPFFSPFSSDAETTTFQSPSFPFTIAFSRV